MTTMSETKELLRRGADEFAPRENVMNALIRRRARKERNRRIAAIGLAITVTLVAFVSLVHSFRTVQRPADQPKDIFARVHGWIAYGESAGPKNLASDDTWVVGDGGIWAVNPERPGHRKDRIRLSDQAGQPVAWSADGSAMLIARTWLPDGTVVSNPSITHPGLRVGLVVLHADGSETRAVTLQPDSSILLGASLSSDGSRVVYVAEARDSSCACMYVVDAQGGTPRLLRSTSMERVVLPGWRGELYAAAFSPDGTKIAYFHGGGDHSHALQVMNADGTNARTLFGPNDPPNPGAAHVYELAWSPDGSQLAFDADGTGAKGIWVIDADGSHLTRVIPGGMGPSWSPDGSRIAYAYRHGLYVADRDGAHVRMLLPDFASSWWYTGGVAWNPLPLRAPSEAASTATTKSTMHSAAATGPSDQESVPDPASSTGETVSAAVALTAIAALGLPTLVVLSWRRRRNARVPS